MVPIILWLLGVPLSVILFSGCWASLAKKSKKRSQSGKTCRYGLIRPHHYRIRRRHWDFPKAVMTSGKMSWKVER